MFTGIGIALWVLTSVAAFFLAKMAPWKRRRTWIGELLLSVAAGLVFGAIATALDFGGWNELDWRAALFVFFGALAAVGVSRLTITPSPGGSS